jgi:hypothetical protein
MRTATPLSSPLSLSTLGVGLFVRRALLAAALCAASMLVAQAPTATAPHAITPRSRAHQPAHRHKRSTATPLKPTAAPAAPLPATPPAPLWPAREKALHASVTWDSKGLRIEADNSSLEQILKDVATATGAKVEGLNADERIFGDYGPGPARDVLTQLLHGSGYNIVMIGDQGEGTPRKVVLSSSQAGSTPSTANSAPASDSAGDEETGTDRQPQAQPPFRSGFEPLAMPRAPQEMQERQQEMQQQQETQQQQPDNPQF